MLMYIQDNADTFPTVDSGLDTDWLNWWGSSIQKSPVVPYLLAFNTNLFRCPTDAAFKELEARKGTFRYPFSYSLSFGGGWPERRLRGMASDFQQIAGTVSGAFKAGEIVNPSEKIMIAEDVSASEYATAFNPLLVYPIFDGSSFLWNNDDHLTRRHRRRANVAFADGRVETVRQAFGEMRDHTDPLK